MDSKIKEKNSSYNMNTIPDESYIGQSVKIKGDVNSKDVVIIGGRVTGNITAGRKIIIENGSRIRGKMDADQIEIFGEVKGMVKSSGKVTLFSSGNLNGDLESAIIIIKEGAVFNGNSNTKK